MKKLFFLLFLTSLISPAIGQDTDSKPVHSNQIGVLFGVITENPDDFYKVKDLLNETPGVMVVDYCFRDKLLNIVFDDNYFVEESLIFELITENFPDAQCFRKRTKPDVYRTQCKDELIKQSTL